MTKDKLFQHQLRRLQRILHCDDMWLTYGRPTVKGQRVIHMIYAASLRSIDRFRVTLEPLRINNQPKGGSRSQDRRLYKQERRDCP